MRKNVLISLLALTGAPVAALANADVVIDKNVWTGDELTVAADGTVTVSTGKEVSIKKSLLPGNYKLQGTVVDNAKIVAVYGGREYALNTEFKITGENAADVTVKVTAVTADTKFSFSGVKFELVYDFAAVVDPILTQLSEITKKGDDNLQGDKRWNNTSGDLKYQSTELATELKAIKNGDYKLYGDYKLWKGADSEEIKTLAAKVTAFGAELDAAVDNYKAYNDAKTAQANALAVYEALAAAGGEWATASEYAKGVYGEAYLAIGEYIKNFGTELEKAYGDREAAKLKINEFTDKVNADILTLKTNVVKANGNDASWTRVKDEYDKAQIAFNEATAEVLEKMPVDGNYKDWNEKVLTDMQAAWKILSDAWKTVKDDKALVTAEKETELVGIIQTQKTAIVDVKTTYINKYNTVEANKENADTAIATLNANLTTATENADVKNDFKTVIDGINGNIAALENKVKADYTAVGHPIETADYSATITSIQNKIDQLAADAAPVIENFNINNEFLAALGSDTGLQKEFNDAKTAVGALKPAVEEDVYDVAAKFGVTASGLQTTIDLLAKDVKAKYDARQLSATTRVALDARVDAAKTAIAKYQKDAEDAVARYDVVSAAVKDYAAKMNALTDAVGANTAVVVKTASTTVSGTTYGDRIGALKVKQAGIESAFKAANNKLDAAHLAALNAISLDPTISTDADALKTAFGNDKKTSEDITKVEAAKILYNAANDLIKSVETRITNHETAGNENYWEAGNADGQLGLKYDDLTAKLAGLKTEIQAQDANIRNVASDVDAITPDNAVEAMSLLAEIKTAVGEINNKLTNLETEASEQIAFVKNENKAKKEVDKNAKAVTTTLTKAKKAFKVAYTGSETIQPQIDAIEAEVKTVKVDAQKERNAENLQKARQDSTDDEGATVKGIDSRIKDLKKKADDLLQLAKDSTANYDAYLDLKDVYDGQKVKFDGTNFTGYSAIFDKCRTLVSENTEGANEAYYLSLIANPNGKYVKEADALLQDIENAYANGDVAEKTDGITNKLKALTANVAELPELAAADKKAYDGRTLEADGKNSQVTEGEKLIAYWNEINNKFNASDIAPTTLKPYLDELATIQKGIKDTQKDVEDDFMKGLSAKNDNDLMQKFESLRNQLKEKEDFINGGEEYNEVISADNTARYEAFLTVVAKTDAANTEAKELIKKYQNITTEELKALVNIDDIINAQEDIYKYTILIEDLKKEAKDSRDKTVSPALWDVEGSYVKQAETYRTELEKAKQDLDDKVNNQARVVLDSKLQTVLTQISAAETDISSFDKNVRKDAFKDVVDFYDKCNATSYRKNSFLINNLDNDWADFEKVDSWIGADLEKAAQNEWNAMYNGKYVGAAGTITEGDLRYAGAKADNENMLNSMAGFGYENAAADIAAYNSIVKTTLDKAIAMAEAAVEADNMYAKLAEVRNFVDQFYNQAVPAYYSAKAQNDAFQANAKAFATLTADYKTLADKIAAAAKYYQEFNVISNTIEGNIAAAFTQVENWQTALTEQNASRELTDRIAGNTIESGKSWYDYNAISGAIGSIYYDSNNQEINNIRAEIVAINTEKQEAIDKFYGKDTEKIQEIETFYDSNCKGLLTELNNLLNGFINNGTKEEAKKDAGLLALEKKVAKAHSDLTKLWKRDLIGELTANVKQIVDDAEDDFKAAQDDFDDAHKPVQGEFARKYEICNNRFAEAKALYESCGDDIQTYDDKIIAVVNKAVNDIKAAHTALNTADEPYDIHEARYKVLVAQNAAADAEVKRVESVVGELNHLDEVSNFDIDNDNVNDTWRVYYAAYIENAKNAVAYNTQILENANNALETGPASALLQANSELSYLESVIKEWVGKLERYAIYNETKLYYRDKVNKAEDAMYRAFLQYGVGLSKSSKGIYDPDGTLKSEYNALEDRVDYLNDYADQFNDWSNSPSATSFDINGQAWGYDESGNTVLKYINYVKDAEGFELVKKTADELVEKVNTLTESLTANSYMKGDVNHDGEILSDDYNAVVKAVLDPNALTGMEFEIADVDRDQSITIGDVTLMANKVTTGRWPNNGPIMNNAPMASAETMSISAQDNGGVQRIAINLNNHKNYVGCQMDIVLPAGMTIVGEGVGDRANGHELYSNDLGNVHRVVISTININSFNGGDAIMYLDVQGGNVDNVALQNIIFAEANGRTTTIGGNTTGINGVEAEGNLKQKVYSVGGQLLDKVKQGINIIRNVNGKAKKVTGK